MTEKYSASDDSRISDHLGRRRFDRAVQLCHPERSDFAREANDITQSKDPYLGGVLVTGILRFAQNDNRIVFRLEKKRAYASPSFSAAARMRLPEIDP